MTKVIIDSMIQSMDKTVQSLKGDLAKVRTGRATPSIVDSVHVDYYGSNVPLTQVANITTPDAKTIQISPWEMGMIATVEKAILAANLGLTPQSDGKVIRITLPPLTEERRKEMVKIIKKMGEESKIGIRNHRRESNDEIKKQEKSKAVSEDDAKKGLELIQKRTDEKIADIDKWVAAKEKDILTI